MSQLNFTEEERTLIAATKAPRESVGYRIGSYASALVPLALIAGYGFLRNDIVAVVVAFVGLLIYVGWQAWRDIRYYALWSSIFRKIAEHEGTFKNVSPGTPNRTSAG